jgi:hypothetical protein
LSFLPLLKAFLSLVTPGYVLALKMLGSSKTFETRHKDDGSAAGSSDSEGKQQGN